MSFPLNAQMLHHIGRAIVSGGKISEKEAETLIRTGQDIIQKSATPEQDAFEVLATAKVATTFLERSNETESPAGRVFNGLEARINSAARARANEVKPSTAPEMYQAAVRRIEEEIREAINSDPDFPDAWRDGAFSGINLPEEGPTIWYNAELLPAGIRTAAALHALFQYVLPLFAEERKLMRRYEDIFFTTYDRGRRRVSHVKSPS